MLNIFLRKSFICFSYIFLAELKEKLSQVKVNPRIFHRDQFFIDKKSISRGMNKIGKEA